MGRGRWQGFLGVCTGLFFLPAKKQKYPPLNGPFLRLVPPSAPSAPQKPPETGRGMKDRPRGVGGNRQLPPQWGFEKNGVPATADMARPAERGSPAGATNLPPKAKISLWGPPRVWAGNRSPLGLGIRGRCFRRTPGRLVPRRRRPGFRALGSSDNILERNDSLPIGAQRVPGNRDPVFDSIPPPTTPPKPNGTKCPALGPRPTPGFYHPTGRAKFFSTLTFKDALTSASIFPEGEKRPPAPAPP